MQDRNTTKADDEAEKPQAPNFDGLARNMVRLFDEGTKVLGALAERNSNGGGPYSMASEAGEATKLLGEIVRHWVSEPSKLVAAQNELFKDYADLWGRSVTTLSGCTPTQPGSSSRSRSDRASPAKRAVRQPTSAAGRMSFRMSFPT